MKLTEETIKRRLNLRKQGLSLEKISSIENVTVQALFMFYEKYDSSLLAINSSLKNEYFIMSYLFDSDPKEIKFCDGCKIPMEESMLNSIDWDSELGKRINKIAEMQHVLIIKTNKFNETISRYKKIESLDILDKKLSAKAKVFEELSKKHEFIKTLKDYEDLIEDRKTKFENLDQLYDKRRNEKELELQNIIDKNKALSYQYSDLVYKFRSFFNHHTIQNVIDLDWFEIKPDLIKHLQNDHQLVLIRHSSNHKHFHIISDGSDCDKCQIQGDLNYWNTTMNSPYLFLFNEKYQNPSINPLKKGVKITKWKKESSSRWVTIDNFDFTTKEPKALVPYSNSIHFLKGTSVVQKNNYTLWLMQTNEIKGFFISFIISWGSSIKHCFGLFDSIHDLVLTVMQYEYTKIRLFMETSIIDFKCNFTKNIIHTEELTYHYCPHCKFPDYECECYPDEYEDYDDRGYNNYYDEDDDYDEDYDDYY